MSFLVKNIKKGEGIMVPKDLPSTGQYDLFRKRTEDIVHENHPLVILAKLIDWKSFSQSFGDKFHPCNGRPGLPTRLMVGLPLH